MSSKTGFIFGIVSGIAVIFVLLTVWLLGGGLSLAVSPETSSSSDSVAVANTDPSPTTTVASTTRTAGSVPVITEEDHIRGDKDAPLTWIEYSDFECPFCKRFAPTMEQMLEAYEGKIRFVYRHFPLSFHRPLALTQAEATECANEFKGSDGFWAMHDFIFDTTSSNGNGMSEDELVSYAVELGINEFKFQTCLDDDRYVDHIESDLSSGSSAGVTGTPGSFFIDADGNAQIVSGAIPFSQIQAVIEAALE